MQKSKFKNDWGLTVAIGLAFIGLISIFFPYFKLDGFSFLSYKIKIGKYNELGDFISGVTAPFLSLSAFILLYLTYKSQKEELQQSRAILNQQNNTLTTQQFETTFFNLLNLHHQIINNIDFDSSYNKPDYEEDEEPRGAILKLNGRDCFKQYYLLFAKNYWDYANEEKKTFEQKTQFDAELEKELIENGYVNFFFKYQADLGHYFRNLYHIVKFIDRSKVENKQHYAGFVRAQLSTFELLLLFYNCLSSLGEKFKPLVETYHLLKNYDINELTVMEQETLYEKSAFKKR